LVQSGLRRSAAPCGDRPNGRRWSRRIGRESVGTNCHDQTIRLFTRAPTKSSIPSGRSRLLHGFRDTAPDAPWRARLDATIAAQYARARAQERQPSAAAGGTRDRLPAARGSIAASRRVGINFAFVISSQWCACRCTACAHSLSEFFLQRTTWPRKRRRQRRPPRQPPRRSQRKLPRKRSNRIHDGQIAASGSQPGRKATPLQRI
jgi:hypothetical protein